ncbi:GGDEF domain-containing protein [Thaumasiovibrio subtropicus]|uniref:GGDEF domain-containing protein n=1 Tax=Thaumasiovibrio subtropicus TaxID=1891207 RepID=UPI000B3620CD|nr:GGDEF domain-containing protein [Thaumasiovibrio subtropicus]
MKKSIRTLQRWLIRRLIYLLSINLLSVIISIFVIYVLYSKTEPNSMRLFFVIAFCLFMANLAFNILAVRRFKQLLSTDALTGLTTRRYLYERLESYQKWLEQSPSLQLAVLFIDVDNFGEVNDYYGHLTGDKAMKKIALLVENEIGTRDTAARFGEEAITVLALVEHQGESEKIANRILEAVRHTQFDYEDHPFNLTVSIGIAMVGDLDDIYSAFVRADKCLQEAKETGKDRLVVEDS